MPHVRSVWVPNTTRGRVPAPRASGMGKVRVRTLRVREGRRVGSAGRGIGWTSCITKISVPSFPRHLQPVDRVGLHLCVQGNAQGRVHVAATGAPTHAEYPGAWEADRAAVVRSHLQLVSSGKGNPFILEVTSGQVDGWVDIRACSAGDAMAQSMACTAEEIEPEA